MATLSGGHLVVRVLEKEGVQTVFCVPGESFLGVLDGLFAHPDIRLISARHEGGAAFMAEAYAKASGNVGICMATRAVGAANLTIGIHTAYQDYTPLVALIGQVERSFKGREAFQEVDLAAFFRHVCKWTVEIDRVERIPELLHRVFHVARSGRPGPVLVALPQDVLEEATEWTESAPYRVSPIRPNRESVDQALEYLSTAERPVIIAGGGVIRSGATPLLIRLAETWQVPVVTAFRRFDAFPNHHPCYAGWLGFGTPRYLLDYIKQADVAVALGTRFSQVSTQDYQLLSSETRLIHVDISPDVIGKVYPPALPIVADVKEFLADLLTGVSPMGSPHRQPIVSELHARYMEFSETKPDVSDEYVDLDGLMHDVVRRFPKDAIITNDAGNFFGWLSRFYRFEKEHTYIGPTSGAMGYGLPAAIGAKLARPDKLVVSFSGDGGFMMTVQEFETAVRYRIPIISIVINNNRYGTIRAHQEKHYPHRVIGTELTNPNFAELAKLMGGYGEQVRRNADFLPAFERALKADRPAVIEVLTHPDILSVNHPKNR